MQPAEKKRNRCATFSAEEKLMIANVCAKYKNILENKKTDQTSNLVKHKQWEKIADEVNALSTIHRTPEVLKRFYENRKREVRKLAAEEKREMFATGGGQNNVPKKEPCHDIILSIMNTKTVYGLQNDFDGDAEPERDENVEPINADIVDSQNDTVDAVYESVHLSDDDNIVTWKKHTPADLQKPVSSSLINSNVKRTSNVEENTPTPKKHQTLPPSRRRPTTQIKALTRSELAEKYDLLLDKRMVMVDYQNKKIQEEIKTMKRERELKVELLELQLKVEKEKLKQLQFRL